MSGRQKSPSGAIVMMRAIIGGAIGTAIATTVWLGLEEQPQPQLFLDGSGSWPLRRLGCSHCL